MAFTTADTNHRIGTGSKQRKPVFLLQPFGKAPIESDEYDSSTEIGGMDLYDWLATMHFSYLKDLITTSEFRSLGISLFFDGEVTIDGESYECLFPIKLSYNKEAVYEDIEGKTKHFNTLPISDKSMVINKNHALYIY
ncbi:hypothetical protein ACGRL8_13170 [Vibrio rumoiensis]|uniref:hypothetical protein n=1 Tax=Vibrio rumoiensis TaxID=76258 RepID=UPI0037492085